MNSVILTPRTLLNNLCKSLFQCYIEDLDNIKQALHLHLVQGLPKAPHVYDHFTADPIKITKQDLPYSLTLFHC